MNKEEKKYTAIDFARYHSGAMPPNEMHALEKATLEDPFLADALDGYMHSKDPGKELDKIKMRLEEKRNQNKVFSISSLSPGASWKIAAMVILFAGTGYFFFAKNSTKETSLVVKKDVPKDETPAIISPLKKDSSASEGNVAFEKSLIEKGKNDLAKLDAPVLKSPQSFKNPVHEEEKKEEKSFPAKQLTVKKENEMVMNNEKISAAHITVSESGEKSFYRSADTTAPVVASNADAKDSGHLVAINKKNETLNEVVVTGYGTQKKKDITGADTELLQGKASGVQVNTGSPYPKDGKELFDQYVKENAIPALDSTGKRIPADILLSFTLNKKGKPNNIKVIESTCKTCEKEAIRLLKEGPGWVGKQGDKGTVRIQF